MPHDYYLILEITSDSSQQEIKSAYRRLAKRFHPDHCGKNHGYFLVVQEAYLVLSDPERRRNYDSSRRQQTTKHQAFQQKQPTYEQEAEPLCPGWGSGRSGRHPRDRRFAARTDELLAEPLAARRRQRETEAVLMLSPQQARSGGQVRLYLSCDSSEPLFGGARTALCSYRLQPPADVPVLISYPPGIGDHDRIRYVLDFFGGRQLCLTVTFKVGVRG